MKKQRSRYCDALDLVIKDCAQLSYKVDDTLVAMAHVQNQPIPQAILNSVSIMGAAKEIASLRQLDIKNIMVNILPADIIVPKHTDTLIYQNCERWHLPIVSNNGCFWWDEVGGLLIMELGNWYGPVPYYNQHAIGNLGKTERIHLVVDLGS